MGAAAKVGESFLKKGFLGETFVIRQFNFPRANLSSLRKLKNWSGERQPIYRAHHKAVLFNFFLAEAQRPELTKGNLAFVWLSSVALMRIPHTGCILTGCFKA